MKRTPRDPSDSEILLLAKNLTNPEARFLVANYYTSQEMRKRGDMQLRHLGDGGAAPSQRLLDYMAGAFADIEARVAKGLKIFAESSPVGRWCMTNLGVGPVITAGLLAHIDIERAPTVGHIWSFTGLNPHQEWRTGEKRPYNPDLKQICYHMGECFKRVSGNPAAFYGQIYREQKEKVVARNEAGGNAERAKTYFTKSAEVKRTLAKGKLPAGNLDRQACNYAAKIFLSHFHAVLHWDKYGTSAPLPYSIAMLNHVHMINIPNVEMFPGLAEAMADARKIGRTHESAKHSGRAVAGRKHREDRASRPS